MFFSSNEKMGSVYFRRVKNHPCGMHPPSKQIVVDRGNAKILKILWCISAIPLRSLLLKIACGFKPPLV